MPFPLIDTHAHLDDGRFAGDLDAVLDRARAAGVERIITIGVDRQTSEAAVELARKHPMLRAAVAIQPNHVHDAGPDDWERIQELAREPTVVAIGETGLDLYWKKAPIELQVEHFVRHLDYARELALPVIIHTRDCDAEMTAALKSQFARVGPIAGIMHSFTGDAAMARACMDCGLHISFAGMVTFKNGEGIRETAKSIPQDRILVETDAPYLAPMPHRGRRNEPAFVGHTLELLAQVRGETAEDLATATARNARKLFKLPTE